MKDDKYTAEKFKPEFEPEELRAAKMAPLVMLPFSDEAHTAVDALLDQTVSFQREQGRRKRGLKAGVALSLKATIAALIGDLLEATLNTESNGYCWRLGDRTKFKVTLATSRHYETLKKEWPLMGLMDVVDGFRGSDDWDGEIYHPNTPNKRWATRLRATSVLLSKLEDFGISPAMLSLHFRTEQKKSQPISLRATKARDQTKTKNIQYAKTPLTDALESDVREINEFLSEWEYSFGAPPVLYRLFNNGDTEDYQWDMGGRFYGSDSTYINWKSENRKGIQIGGEATAEIDIKACQLTMLHGLFGFDYEVGVDLYEIDGFDRDEVKQTVHIIVGNGRVSGRRNPVQIKLLEQYPFLNDLEARGLNSLRLQAMDSNIMNQTLLTLKRQHNIPALPIHDCLIVRARDIGTAEEVFSEVFDEHIGVKPTLETELQ